MKVSEYLSDRVFNGKRPLSARMIAKLRQRAIDHGLSMTVEQHKSAARWTTFGMVLAVLAILFGVVIGSLL